MTRERIIKQYPNYTITDTGKVKNITTGKILKPTLNDGYLGVNLTNSEKRRLVSIHQLIAMAFLGHDPNGHKTVVDHINNNPLDNRIENLQLTTQRWNSSKDKVRELPTGVSTKGKKYLAQIYANNKVNYLGVFKTPEEASAVYQEALANI